ncbi:LicD family protein [Saccharospirillum impatiens]|uniref:LicD family protein n=1 Tax=Saccharospirillum impatiens TaxID=169438 RepID=UPI0003F76630|nr:LicD family protein [Saccharospirillum impatiens]
MRLFKPSSSSSVQRRQLIDTIDVLDAHNIPYHLEGGTLLGIVRDGDLLPWDKDTDLSIMSADVPRLQPALSDLKARGWRLSERTFKQNEAFAKQPDVRLVKVKDRYLKVLAGPNTLDLFVKYSHEGHAYWIAASNVMRVSAHHYEGFETVPWEGRQVKVPVDYEGYLEAKFGNWKVPQKEWHCDMEKTVVRPRVDDD